MFLSKGLPLAVVASADYGIALRNGIIAITAQPNVGQDFDVTKDDWSQLIICEKIFASLSSDLIVIDQALGR